MKRQTRGLAQGKADAVRLSALVLSFHEMTFVLRCCHRWTAEKMPQGVRMMCLHSQRMVVDLWQIVPKDFNPPPLPLLLLLLLLDLMLLVHSVSPERFVMINSVVHVEHKTKKKQTAT